MIKFMCREIFSLGKNEEEVRSISEQEVRDFIYELRESGTLRRKTFLGRGSSRTAYDMGNGYSVKLPNDWYSTADEDECSRGIWQSRKEIEVWKNVQNNELILEALNPIVLYGEIYNTLFIVSEIVETAEDMGYSYSTNIVQLAKRKKPRNKEVYTLMFDVIADELKSRFNVSRGDLFDNVGNFGFTKDNRLVIIDYGFCGWAKSNYPSE